MTKTQTTNGPANTYSKLRAGHTRSLSSPGPVFTLVSPSLCDEPTSDASGEGACHAEAGYYQRHPKWCGAHASMMVGSAHNAVEVADITPSRMAR